MRLTEQQIVNRMHRAYLRRLHEVLGEADVMWRDNVVIAKDLKVRHTESGIEYTVQDVITDDSGNVVTIRLRKPEMPRFDPAGEEFVGETSEISSPKNMTHGEIVAKKFNLSIPDEEASETVFDVSEEDFDDSEETKDVTREEFESEYTVKTKG